VTNWCREFSEGRTDVHGVIFVECQATTWLANVLLGLRSVTVT
jgi:hypothetical protein